MSDDDDADAADDLGCYEKLHEEVIYSDLTKFFCFEYAAYEVFSFISFHLVGVF